MKGKAKILIVDCPWKTKDNLTMSKVKRGAKSQYKVMELDDLKALPIKDVVDPEGAVIAHWVLGSMLQEGMDVMKAWGFNHKQTYVWVKTKKNPLTKLIGRVKKLKTNFDLKSVLGLMADVSMSEILDFGMGRLFRQTHEICLIGTNSNKVYKALENKSQRSVCFGSIGEHSEKPDDLHEALEIMFPGSVGKRLELFGRREKDGWVVLGNEVGECLDIRESLPKLIAEIEGKEMGWSEVPNEKIPVVLEGLDDVDWNLTEEESAEFMKSANEWASSFVSDWDLEISNSVGRMKEGDVSRVDSELEEYEREMKK